MRPLLPTKSVSILREDFLSEENILGRMQTKLQVALNLSEYFLQIRTSLRSVGRSKDPEQGE